MGKPIFEVCGDCAFWRLMPPGPKPIIGAQRLGMCHGAPPIVVPIMNAGQIVGGMNMRPQMPADYTACGLFADDDEAANDQAN